MLVALTGGIGSGKSLAGEYFASLGAVVVDSDQLARDVVERGTPGFDEIVSHFGDVILRDGEIDRAALADIVFKDEGARKKLEEIIHPAIRASVEALVRSLPQDAIIINQIPLLVETNGAERFDYVIAISTPLELRKSRIRERGLRESEIEARIAAQVTDSEREAIADFIIFNDADKDSLLRQVEDIYLKLKAKK